MQVIINQTKCRGCGSCEVVCPLFEIVKGKARLAGEMTTNDEESINLAKDNCPFEAITIEE